MKTNINDKQGVTYNIEANCIYTDIDGRNHQNIMRH